MLFQFLRRHKSGLARTIIRTGADTKDGRAAYLKLRVRTVDQSSDTRYDTLDQQIQLFKVRPDVDPSDQLLELCDLFTAMSLIEPMSQRAQLSAIKRALPKQYAVCVETESRNVSLSPDSMISAASEHFVRYIKPELVPGRALAAQHQAPRTPKSVLSQQQNEDRSQYLDRLRTMDLRDKTCNRCKQKGHIAPICPQRSNAAVAAGARAPQPTAVDSELSTVVAQLSAQVAALQSSATAASAVPGPPRTSVVQFTEPVAAVPNRSAVSNRGRAAAVSRVSSDHPVLGTLQQPAQAARRTVAAVVPASASVLDSSYRVLWTTLSVALLVLLIAVVGLLSLFVCREALARFGGSPLDSSVAAATGRLEGLQQKAFLLDSAASAGVCNNLTWYSTFDSCDVRAFDVVSARQVVSQGSGDIPFTAYDSSTWQPTTLLFRDVSYLPDQPHNLLPVSTLKASGYVADFGELVVRGPGGETFPFREVDGLYPWVEFVSAAPVVAGLSARDPTDWQWFRSEYSHYASIYGDPDTLDFSH